jgi:hypothetical protein
VNHFLGLKTVCNVVPALVEGASATAIPIDCIGYDHCTFLVPLGVMDLAVTALKVQESDTLTEGALASAADVSGLIAGTSANIAGTTSALPAADDDGKIWRFDVDLKKRKRYLSVVATVAAAAEEEPTTAALCGCEEILRV